MEDKIFRKTYSYTVNCRDCYDNFSVVSILNFFQDIASKHVEKWKCGFDDLIRKGYLWVLVRTKFDILKNPNSKDNLITVETWERDRSRADFTRDYIIYSENGEKLIIGTSKWCLLDMNTRRVLPTKLIQETLTYKEKYNYQNEIKKLVFPNIEASENFEEKVTFTKVDHNGHMNNTHYAEFILDAIRLKKNEVIKSFQIDYLKESFLDDIIGLKTERTEDEVFIEGYRNNDLLFKAKIELNNI